MNILKCLILGLFFSTPTLALATTPGDPDHSSVVWTTATREYIMCLTDDHRSDRCFSPSHNKRYISIYEYAGSEGFKTVYRHGLITEGDSTYIIMEVSK